MSREINRDERYQFAADKMRRKKEKEDREEQELYDKVTSGNWWLSFRIVVFLSTFMALATLIDHFFDGSTKKLDESSWQIDHEWDYPFHSVLDVKGYMFTPDYYQWSAHVENSLKLTRSPIFQTGKKLTFDTKMNGRIVEITQFRSRSIFNWFPFVQLFLLIPLATFIFKRRSPWFNFGRIVSYTVVIPGILMIYFFTLM